jgi:hypothetical protein
LWEPQTPEALKAPEGDIYFAYIKPSSGTVILQNITPFRAGDNNFFCGKGNEIKDREQVFLHTTE